MGVSDGIVAAVAVLALLVATLALFYSRRAARAAGRSEAAAQRAADLAAGEQSARRRLVQDHAIRWALKRQGAATNDLVNIGDAIAYDVRVEVPQGMDLLGLPTARAEVPSGDSITIGVARSAASRGGIIRVLWRDAPDGPDHEWQHPAV
ncbi:hypothetical protein OF117_18550 [Geodermatophilus sp. YIM 151500]|uniref:hypothetical protein n=1 Tax=Geodermatophilus sp. YIM 151500 TaxID=2984531 RepID=UPI0021E4DDA5|nr:hypothetical protein [Geodermatophilus sp. YIM 151500]MCV2491352.1 hypothetical protein [Geodermatophilus sp. YIM 151500]